MRQDTLKLLAAYQDKSALRQVGEWVQITTPYVDRNNCYIPLYARSIGDGFVLTDDGRTLNDLENNGFDAKNQAHQNSLQKTLSSFGVQMVEGGLRIYATANPEHLAKHQVSLVHAMLAASGLSFPIPATDHSGVAGSSTCVETASGHVMDLLNPQAVQVSLKDIAASLANIMRFTGHCPETVAEHSLLVDWIGCHSLEGPKPDEGMRLHWLLHDAHEAYTGDITTPMKRAIGTERIKEIQDGLDRVIYEALHLPLPNAAERVRVHRADRLALRVAAADLLPSRGRWAGDPDSPMITAAKLKRKNLRREGLAGQRWLKTVYALADAARSSDAAQVGAVTTANAAP